MVSSRDKDFGHKNWWKNKHLKDTRDAGISPPTCSLSSALFYHLKWHLLSLLPPIWEPGWTCSRTEKQWEKGMIIHTWEEAWESVVGIYCSQTSNNNINYFKYIFIEHLFCASHCNSALYVIPHLNFTKPVIIPLS